MRAVASTACAVAISGCLIVRADEQHIEEPCPATVPEVLAAATGPLVIGDSPEDIEADHQEIYFVGANGVLSRMSIAGGAPSELTSDTPNATALALDRTALYVGTDEGLIMRRPRDGSAPTAIGEGFTGVTELVVDDTSVVWASSNGIDRWSKADGTITHLADASLVLGLGAADGRYYFSDTPNDRVRRTPPTEDLATPHFPGPLVVDGPNLYYFEAGTAFEDFTGAIRLIPRDGGDPITTADELPPAYGMAAGAQDLYFITQFRDLYRIRQVSKFGGAVRTLACGDDSHARRMFLAVSRTGVVYWTDGVGLYRVVPGPNPVPR